MDLMIPVMNTSLHHVASEQEAREVEGPKAACQLQHTWNSQENMSTLKELVSYAEAVVVQESECTRAPLQHKIVELF